MNTSRPAPRSNRVKAPTLVVAGGETAGIPLAAWIADRLSLPMLYVRKQPKGFGRNAQIEGELKVWVVPMVSDQEHPAEPKPAESKTPPAKAI